MFRRLRLSKPHSFQSDCAIHRQSSRRGMFCHCERSEAINSLCGLLHPYGVRNDNESMSLRIMHSVFCHCETALFASLLRKLGSKTKGLRSNLRTMNCFASQAYGSSKTYCTKSEKKLSLRSSQMTNISFSMKQGFPTVTLPRSPAVQSNWTSERVYQLIYKLDKNYTAAF